MIRRLILAGAAVVVGGFLGLVLAVEGGWPLIPVTFGMAIAFGAFAWWQS